MGEDSWFVKPEDLDVPKRAKRTVDPDKKLVPTSRIKQIVAKSEIYKKPRYKNGLYCSNIGCDKYYSVKDELINFWSYDAEKREYHKDVYTEQSNIKHKIVQEHWFSAGILHSGHDVNGKFDEIRCYYPEYGLSGRMDLVLPDPNYLDAFGLSKDPMPDREYWMVTDIKETDTKQYVGVGQNLSQKYRTQNSLYIQWAHENLDAHPTQGAFYYLDRDNPRKYKLIGYEKEQDLIDLAFNRCEEFWEYVNKKEIPEFDGSEEFIAQCIEEQVERNWPTLSGVSND